MVFKPEDVYRKQLQQHGDFGHALWCPVNPRDGYTKDTEIGDVGYFMEGTFRRICNVVENVDTGKGKSHSGTLPMMTPLDPVFDLFYNENWMSQKLICSDSIKHIQGGAGVAG